MKIAISASVLVLLFASCQKEFSNKGKEESKSSAVSSDALTPLACHTTAFSSNYPVVAGQVPPFGFTKTLYSDTRVKTINVLSRAYSIHAALKKQAYEIIGTFSYAPNKATLTGTKQLWEYYRTPTGTAASRSISKQNISLTFYFNTSGYCYRVDDNARGEQVLSIEFDQAKPNAMSFIAVETELEGIKFYYPRNDQYGNNLSYDLPYNRWASRVNYVYDYSIPRNGKSYSFIPTQNLISQEYSLLEVMQWLPQPTHQRKSVSAEFYPYTTNTYPFNTGQKVLQTQYYRSYVFDAKGNQVSLTYADNVLQKTTWFCK